MRSYRQWKLNESVVNNEWEHFKKVQLPVRPEVKAFVAPRIGKIQEAVVQKLHEVDPKIQSYRDVPPEVRDEYAQGIMASVLEIFYSGEVQQPIKRPPAQPQQPAVLPQDIPPPKDK